MVFNEISIIKMTPLSQGKAEKKMNPIDQSTLELAYTHLSRPPDAHMVLRNTILCGCK